MRRALAFLFLLLLLVLPASPVLAAGGPWVLRFQGPRAVWLWSGPALLRVDRRDARLELFDTHQRRWILRERAEGGLGYEREGRRFGLGGVEDVERVPSGVKLRVRTEEGGLASLQLRFLSRRTLAVDFAPPQPEAVDAFEERLHSPRDELIYGLTERLRDSPALAPPLVTVPRDDVFPPEVGSLDRRGETVEMIVVPTFSLYAPFYQTSRGYGLAVSGTTFGRFDLASSEAETLSFRFEAGTTPESRRFRFHVFLGPRHQTILEEHARVTGRPFVPPAWAFRHWRWRGELAIGEPALLDGVPINAQVAEDVLRYEEFGIPPGVYLFDRPVFPGNYGLARWEWDTERLPNPEAMLASLRRRGYRLGLWSGTWACGSQPGENGYEARRLGHLAPGPGGEPICSDLGGSSFILDLSKAEAVRWWKQKIRNFVGRYGIQAIKLDRGEEHIASEATDIWFDGRTGRELRNAYPSLQARLHRDALAEAHAPGDFVVLARPGYGDTSQYAVFWGGDIPASEFFGAGPGTDLGLRSAIISQQRAAFLGAPIWGSDTGGYYEFKDREVFARWIEFSTFSGIMEIGGVGSHAPWDMPTEPRFDPEMIEIYRRYTQLRETLLPYIVKTAREASRGIPIVRPMPFLDRHDPELRDRWDQYLFGPDLLVAPVWRVGQRSREIYFPRGRWTSYWDAREVHVGPGFVRVDVPLDLIPVFVRGKARVPGAARPDRLRAGRAQAPGKRGRQGRRR